MMAATATPAASARRR